MKKIILLLFMAVLFSCTKEETTVIIVENIEVQLNAKSAFSVTESTFRSTEHTYPVSYKAYFISQENKGEYLEGQLVKTIDVTAGLQTIVVPKLKYKVYVTNFIKDGSWYTWNDAINQLPLGSDILYLFGSNEIDYSTQLTGEVEVKNPYSAIMIKNDPVISTTRVPREYTSSSDYVLNGEWWLKYVRNSHNTAVWILDGKPGNRTIQISAEVEPNKIYKYTLNTDIPDTNSDNNFNLTVQEFEETIEEEVNIW